MVTTPMPNKVRNKGLKGLELLKASTKNGFSIPNTTPKQTKQYRKCIRWFWLVARGRGSWGCMLGRKGIGFWGALSRARIRRGWGRLSEGVRAGLVRVSWSSSWTPSASICLMGVPLTNGSIGSRTGSQGNTQGRGGLRGIRGSRARGRPRGAGVWEREKGVEGGIGPKLLGMGLREKLGGRR